MKSIFEKQSKLEDEIYLIIGKKREQLRCKYLNHCIYNEIVPSESGYIQYLRSYRMIWQLDDMLELKMISCKSVEDFVRFTKNQHEYILVTINNSEFIC